LKVAEIFETLEYGPAPESSAPAIRWLDAHERSFGIYINGRWRKPVSGESFDTINPATAQPIARIAQASPDDVDAAVRAARAAFRSWRDLGGHGRARHLYAIARHIQKHSRDFAVLESMDNGKPIRESRDIDIPLVARHFYQGLKSRVPKSPAVFPVPRARIMRFKVIVKLKEGVLDPQGQAILRSIRKMGHPEVNSVRQGKFFDIEIEGENQEQALKLAKKLADSIFSNPIIESFEVEEAS
jgi:phosphoribosylformylglycinamidine synthase PurS subunit